jgi:signal transduction histidine kinase/HD-like signal output (HDOD) protein
MVLSQVESLPTLPAVASRLLEATLDERTGAGDVAALIESDQSLSARVLSLIRRANVGSDVQTVHRAVVLLGCDVVRSLVLGVQIFDLFCHRSEKSDSRFDRTGFWRHCLAVGCAARLMVEKRSPASGGKAAKHEAGALARPDEAFVCGLLHDLGKVVFDACFPKSYDRVVERVEATRTDIADVERDVFGMDHAVAGHRLAVHWKLPQVIAECIWMHHQSPETTPTRLAFPDHVLLVQAADRLVRQMGIGYSGNHSPDTWSQPFSSRLGLNEKAVTEIMAELPEAIELRAELLGLQEITSREVLQETIARTNSELARLNTELILANRALQQRSRTLDALSLLNRGLAQDHRHETVVGALVQAVRLLAPSAGVGVFVCSPCRQVTVVGLLPPEQSDMRIEVLPNEAVGNLDTIRHLERSAPAESTLPPALLDRVACLAEQTPLRCWPMACEGRLVAGVLTSGADNVQLDEPLAMVGSWAASWFNTAEAGFVSRELTEELAEINRRFINSQAEVARMRSTVMIGEMAAGAAHEINNPLAVISGRAQILSRGRSKDDDIRRSADIIMEHAHRASAIVTELMDFAKPEAPKPTTWAIQPLLEEIRRTWLEKKAILPDQFVLELSDDLPAIHADASQVRVLCDELIRNAVQAMGNTPEPRLIVNCRADVADDTLVIRVEDNGCGMTPEVAEHAFDPFFSHRSAGRGRGLGLSRAARYAEINGGKIRISSRVKEGTAVFVELPVSR